MELEDFCKKLPLELQEMIVEKLPRELRVRIGCDVSETSFWSKSLNFSRERLQNICVQTSGEQSEFTINKMLKRYDIVA